MKSKNIILFYVSKCFIKIVVIIYRFISILYRSNGNSIIVENDAADAGDGRLFKDDEIDTVIPPENEQKRKSSRSASPRKGKKPTWGAVLTDFFGGLYESLDESENDNQA